MSIHVGNVFLKPQTSVNCLYDDEFTCQHCGECQSEGEDYPYSKTSCFFCRRFHACGNDVAKLSTALEIKVDIRETAVSVDVYGARLVVWECEVVISF